MPRKKLPMNQRITCFFLMFHIGAAISAFAAPIKVGIIGLDAHAVPWTQIILGPKAPPPMSVEHTLEIYAFMEAADESLRQGGRPVSVPGVLEKAQRKP